MSNESVTGHPAWHHLKVRLELRISHTDGTEEVEMRNGDISMRNCDLTPLYLSHSVSFPSGPRNCMY